MCKHKKGLGENEVRFLDLNINGERVMDGSKCESFG